MGYSEERERGVETVLKIRTEVSAEKSLGRLEERTQTQDCQRGKTLTERHEERDTSGYTLQHLTSPHTATTTQHISGTENPPHNSPTTNTLLSLLSSLYFSSFLSAVFVLCCVVLCCVEIL
jgi:hypothetical protein